MLQNALFIIIGLAIMVLIGWGFSDFFTSAETPLFVRIIVGIAAIAGITLLGIVIRDRIKQAKKEDFKEVEK